MLYLSLWPFLGPCQSLWAAPTPGCTTLTLATQFGWLIRDITTTIGHLRMRHKSRMARRDAILLVPTHATWRRCLSAGLEFSKILKPKFWLKSNFYPITFLRFVTLVETWTSAFVRSLPNVLRGILEPRSGAYCYQAISCLMLSPIQQYDSLLLAINVSPES